MTTQRTHRTRRVSLVVGGVLPVTIALVATVVMFTWLPELPESVAVHWGPDGPDGFASPLLSIVMPIAIVVAFCIFSVWSAWKTRPSGLLVPNQKFVLVTGIWLATVLSIAFAGSLAIQRESADTMAATEGDVGIYLLAGAVAGVVLAVAGWFILPAADSTATPATPAEPVAVEAGERVSWSKTVRLAGPATVLAWGALVLALGAVIATALAAPNSVWFAVSALAVAAVLLLFTSRWRIVTDARGLTVRSIVGWPKLRVARDDIAAVHVVKVDPAAEFGGWGYRWGGAERSGIILQSGDAIEVTKTNGKRFVVTVDDAVTGASVLAAFVASPVD